MQVIDRIKAEAQHFLDKSFLNIKNNKLNDK